jgi:glucose PTS system EIICBA or EIICB component
VMNQSMGSWLNVTDEMLSNPSYAKVFGIPTLQTGVFGGIIIGLVAAWAYNKYSKVELPQFLGFFAGKRLVPIMTAVFAIFVGLILTVVWPVVQSGMNNLSEWLMGGEVAFASFFFGMVKRLLIPFGLHHIFHAPFWFEFGSYTTTAGEVVRGDLNIFFAQLKDGVEITAGNFMAGEFPVMMFGLPAAALAMYHEAKDSKKKLVAGLLFSAALTSFLTGITEPIEFSFLFVAPLLFLLHAILDGISFAIMTVLDINLGYTFSGGFIDFLLFGIVPNREPWLLAVLVGLVYAVIYYVVFRFAIRKFNLKTPGREEEVDVAAQGTTTIDELPYQVLEALGGVNNIKHLDACITRLRVELNNKSIVNKDQLKKVGAAGVLEVGNNIQAIFGPRAEIIKGQIADIMSGKTPTRQNATSNQKEAPTETGKIDV